MPEVNEFYLIQTILIVLTLATAVSYVFKLIQLPIVLGFILSGILIGPSGFKLVQNPSLINAMAQIGILFLLFILGLELSIAKLRQLRFYAPLAGILQLTLTIILFTAIFSWCHFPIAFAILLGAIMALSSTAIVLKSLEDQGETDTVHGRLILGMLIIQDFSIVPLMSLLPTLNNPLSSHILLNLGGALFKALALMVVVILLSVKIIPMILDKLAATRSKELFTLSVASIGLGTAFLTGFSGLSYEAGAFIAGLTLSGSIYSRQIVADSRPFRDVFATLFFVSVGMLVNTEFLVQHAAWVLLFTLLLIIGKSLAAYSAVWILRFPVKTALWAGLSLFQVGEFSFILLKRTVETATANPEWHQLMLFWNPLLINSIVLSMFITPLVIRTLPKLLYAFSEQKNANLQPKEHRFWVPLPPLGDSLKKHVLIAGYGPIAHNIVSALALHEVDYTIIEMNLNTIRQLKKEGKHCLFGDSSHPDILKSAGVEQAQILVITFPDIRSAEMTLQYAKQLNPALTCFVRARYRSDIERLYTLGADEVIYEELETSISFVLNTLHALGNPIDTIQPILNVLRESENKLLHEIPLEEQPTFGRLSLLAQTKIEWLTLKPDSSISGKTLIEAEIEAVTGVNILALVTANGQTPIQPDPNYIMQALDILIVMGNIEQLHKLEMLISPVLLPDTE